MTTEEIAEMESMAFMAKSSGFQSIALNVDHALLLLSTARNVAEVERESRDCRQVITTYCEEIEALEYALAAANREIIELERLAHECVDKHNWFDHDNSPYGTIRGCTIDLQARAADVLRKVAKNDT